MPDYDAQYPEHAKLKEVQPLSQACGAFLEWLGEQGYTLCEADAHGEYWPIRKSRDRLLAEHFQIDLNALETEKSNILAEIRSSGLA